MGRGRYPPIRAERGWSFFVWSSCSVSETKTIQMVDVVASFFLLSEKKKKKTIQTHIYIYMKNRQLLIHMFEACKDGVSVSQLHSHVLKHGFLHDSFFATKLTSLHAQHSSLNSARKLFVEIPEPTVYLWNATLRSHCKENQWGLTLHLFKHMLTTAKKPDNFTLPIVLKACAGLKDLKTGKAIHAFLKKKKKDGEIGLDMFVGSALVQLYTKCGELSDALRVFEEFHQPDVVLWTSMVTGYQQNENAEEALSFFSQMMMVDGMNPDPVTLVSVVSACAQLGSIESGRCVHGFMMRRGLDVNSSLVNSLLNLYSKTGSINKVRNLFGTMRVKDVISWSSMIACYAQNDKAVEALILYSEMVDMGLEPNSITVVSALQACAAVGDMDQGRRIHELTKRKGFELNVSVSTALVDMYMKSSCLEEAVDLFERMPKKDAVSWAVLISGYAQNGSADKSFRVFCRMLADDAHPDAVTMVKILIACSHQGVLQQALCLHGFLMSSGFADKLFVGAALIHLYSKCGSLDNSISVFEGLSEKDDIVWSSMLAAYGINGCGREAINTFNQMIETLVTKPNSVTFLSILSACSHNGLIHEGIKIFHRMVHEYHIEPNLDHYSIMVDLLGRTGQLEEAMEFINQMPMPPGPQVLGALLGACRIHHNVNLGEIVAKKLLQLDPEHTGYYTLLSNIYAENGKWVEAAKVKTLIKEKGLKKMPGNSSIVTLSQCS